MALSPRWRRILRVCAIGALILVAGIAVYINIQQRVLRWRAERLLSDIRELQLGKSTWADAQKIMTRWGGWGWYAGSCTQQRCTYHIAIQDISHVFPELTLPGLSEHSEACLWCYRFRWPYQILGGRPAMVAAGIDVIRGVVWGKGFELDVFVPESLLPYTDNYVLDANAMIAWRRGDFRHPINPKHPEYSITRPNSCQWCETIYATFTPYADNEVINELMSFNLDCLTRLLPCRHPDEIAPSMWRRYYASDGASEPVETSLPDNGCSMSPEIIGRNALNLVVAEVISVRQEKGPWGVGMTVTFGLSWL